MKFNRCFIPLCVVWLILPIVSFSTGAFNLNNVPISGLLAIVISIITVSLYLLISQETSAKLISSALVGIATVGIIILFGGFPESLVEWLGIFLIFFIFVISSIEFSMTAAILGLFLMVVFYFFGEKNLLISSFSDYTFIQLETVLFSNMGLFGSKLSEGIEYVVSFSVFTLLLNLMGFPYYLSKITEKFFTTLKEDDLLKIVSKLMFVQHISPSATQAIAIMEDFEPNGISISNGKEPHKSIAIPAIISSQAPIGVPIFGAAIFFMIDQVGLPFRDIFLGLIPLSIMVSLTTLIFCADIRSVGRIFLVAILFLTILALTYFVGKLIIINNSSGIIVNSIIISVTLILICIYFCRSNITKVSIVDSGVSHLLKRSTSVHHLLFVHGPHQFIPCILFVYLILSDVSIVDAVFLSSAIAAFVIFASLMISQTNDKRFDFIIEASNGYSVLLLEFGRYLSRNILALSFAGILLGVFFSTGFPSIFLTFYTDMFGFNIYIFIIVSGLFCLVIGAPFPVIPTYLLTSSIFLPILVGEFFNLGIAPNVLGISFFILCVAVIATLTPPDCMALDHCMKWHSKQPSPNTGTLWKEIIWLSTPLILVAIISPFSRELEITNSFGIAPFMFAGITTFIAIIFFMFGLRWIKNMRQYSSLISGLIMVVIGVFLFLPRSFSDGIWHTAEHYSGERYFEIVRGKDHRSNITLVFADDVNSPTNGDIVINIPMVEAGTDELHDLGVTVKPSNTGMPVVTNIERTNGVQGINAGSILTSFSILEAKGHYGIISILLMLIGFVLIWLENRRKF